MQPLRFILQAIDADYGHPAFATMFVVERPDELRALIGMDAKADPDFEMHDCLEPHEVVAVNRHFGLGFDPRGRQTYLTKRTGRSEPPYLVHTGYELVLMLEGRKPFTRMGSEFYPPHRHYDEDQFDRYVAQGALHKEVQLEPFDEPLHYVDGRVFEGFRTVYYTLKGEEWRIPAWKLVSEASRKSGWNESFERLEGMLLGYEEWQNDWWYNDIRRRNSRWGALSLYLAVTEAELAAIEDAGYRALPLRSKSLKLLSSMSEEDDDAVRSLLTDVESVAVVRFSAKAGRFLKELANEPQVTLHTLAGERVKDLNRLIVSDIEVVLRRGS
ncbi:hypothetical protein SAMN02990966_05392 [Rhodospirillales bacterium URHD0017]|nr:hypothetical protein SAMN02990966_05392 [Rhodospirillales bacterium URHD0017]